MTMEQQQSSEGVPKKFYFIVGVITCLAIIVVLSLNLQATNGKDKNYDSESQTVILTDKEDKTNTISIKLNTPLNYMVMPGRDRKVAELTFNLAKEQDLNFVDNMKLIDLSTGKEISRTLTYKVKIVNRKEVSDLRFDCKNKTVSAMGRIVDTSLPHGDKDVIWYCENGETEKRTIDEVSWVSLSDTKLKVGETTIGIFTDVAGTDNVEWIPTFFGTEITEWATWTSGLNVGLVTYYTMNESSGNAIDSLGLANATVDAGVIRMGGLINNSFNWTNVNSNFGLTISKTLTPMASHSISFWINKYADLPTHGGGGYLMDYRGSPEFIVEAQGQYCASAGQLCSYDNGAWRTYGTIPTGAWYHVVIVWDSATGKSLAYLNGTQLGTNQTYGSLIGINYTTRGMIQGGNFKGRLDEFGVWNRTLSYDEVTTLYNSGAGMTYNPNPSPPTYAEISGLVLYNSAAVANAYVQLINQATNVTVATTMTNASGGWKVNSGLSTTINYTAVAYYNSTLKGAASPYITPQER